MNENKFDSMGQIYSKYRPNYPAEFIDYLYISNIISVDSVIADIGSGTGILTSQLLKKGNKVFAVEPNEDMRKTAESLLCRDGNYISINGSAEKTGLADSCVDVITVAQAFHWFERVLFRKECKRILRHGGKVALVWNSRDEDSDLVRENDLLNKKFCPNFKGFSGNMRGALGDDDFLDFFGGKYECRKFNNDTSCDKEGFIGRNCSASYALKSGDPNFDEYISALGVLFDKYNKNNVLIMPQFTRSYVGDII